MIKVNIRKIEILDEAKEDDVYEKYKDQLSSVQALQDEWMTFTNEWIADHRQKRLKFLPWATKWMISKKEAFAEHAFQLMEKLYNALEDFEKHAQQFKKKDINQYKNVEELARAYKTDVLDKRISKSKKKREKDPEWSKDPQNSMAIYEDDRFFVVRPVSVEGSCFFGKKTKWCIAQEGNSYFDEYTRDGNVFYFVKDDAAQENDQFAWIAIQANEQGIEQFWDRYDDSHQMGQMYDLNWPEESVDNIMREVEEHLMDYPPEDGVFAELSELDQEINNGDYNERLTDGHLHFYSDLQDYDPPYSLTLNATFFIKLRIPVPEGVTDIDIIDIFNEWEDDFRDSLADMSPIDEFSGRGDYGGDWIEMHFRNMGEFVGVDLEFDLQETDYGGSVYHTDESNVRDSIEYYRDNFGSDDNVEELKEEIVKIFTEAIHRNVSSPGRDRYMEIHKDIEKIENSFKRIYAIWEEDDPGVGMSLILPGETEWACPVFAPKPPEAAGELDQMQYNDQWQRQMRISSHAYHRNIKDIIADQSTGVEKIFTDAVASYADDAAAFAQRQIRIDFPGLKLPPLNQEFAGMRTSGFHRFESRVPGMETLKNPELRLGRRISWRGYVELTWADTLTEIDAAMKWAQYIDKHYADILGKMEGPLSELKKKIDMVHEKAEIHAYSGFKERIGELKNLGLMSENRKKIKIKLQKK